MEVEVRIRPQDLASLRRVIDQLPARAEAEAETVAQRLSALYAAEIRRRVPVVSGDASGSVTARKSGRPKVAVGGKKAPYFQWLDFGGRTGRGAVRSRPKGGRYVYPARAALTADIQRALAGGADAIARWWSRGI